MLLISRYDLVLPLAEGTCAAFVGQIKHSLIALKVVVVFSWPNSAKSKFEPVKIR